MVRVRVSLGFRDKVRVRVKVRVSFRLATFMYSVWPPVSLRVRVSLYPIFLTPNPKNFSVPF